jgi:hypothetical protein
MNNEMAPEIAAKYSQYPDPLVGITMPSPLFGSRLPKSQEVYVCTTGHAFAYVGDHDGTSNIRVAVNPKGAFQPVKWSERRNSGYQPVSPRYDAQGRLGGPQRRTEAKHLTVRWQ